MIPCRALDFLLRLVTQTAFGCVHDPLKGQIVIRAGDHAEIGHRITDFQTLIKARAADHFVRQADGQETILKSPHLMARPHQNCHVIQGEWCQPACAALPGFDLIADPTRFFLTVPMADQAQLLALGRLGPEGLAQPPLIARDHARGRSQNMRG